MSGTHWHSYATFGLIIAVPFIAYFYGEWKKKRSPLASESDILSWRRRAILSYIILVIFFGMNLLPAQLSVPAYLPSESAETNMRQIIETQTKTVDAIDDLTNTTYLSLLGIIVCLWSLTEKR